MRILTSLAGVSYILSLTVILRQGIWRNPMGNRRICIWLKPHLTAGNAAAALWLERFANTKASLAIFPRRFRSYPLFCPLYHSHPYYHRPVFWPLQGRPQDMSGAG